MLIFIRFGGGKHEVEQIHSSANLEAYYSIWVLIFIRFSGGKDQVEQIQKMSWSGSIPVDLEA